MSLGTDAFLQSWDLLEVYDYMLNAIIRQVLNKLWQSMGTLMTLITLMWPQKEWVPDLLGALVDHPWR